MVADQPAGAQGAPFPERKTSQAGGGGEQAGGRLRAPEDLGDQLVLRAAGEVRVEMPEESQMPRVVSMAGVLTIGVFACN